MSEVAEQREGPGSKLWPWLLAPKDIAALAAFRVALGLVVTVSAVRFLVYGWVGVLFSGPTFRFTYWGFDWLPPLPSAAMGPAFIALAVLGVFVTLGLLYRLSMALLWVAFTYVQLSDVTNYLNHYYLMVLLLGLMFFIPAHRAYSLDAWMRPSLRRETLPAAYTYMLRFQVLTVYFFAGMAKLNSDWLLHAQPLNIWLSSRTSTPIIGELLDERWVAYVFSWFGFLFDTFIAFFLMAKRTRPYAYVLVVVFHAMTSLLFPIGMFPVIMILAATVFFDPAWPRWWAERLGRAAPAVAPTPFPASPTRAMKFAFAAACLYAAIQIAVPLRTHLYGGDVSWHEQGMRFSWRVMTREKNGTVVFITKDRDTGRERHVPPSRYLNRLQEREMSSQPDLILQMAKRIEADFAKDGHRVAVFADSQASLNGRRIARLIDPDVDLTQLRDDFLPKTWVLPAPTSAPLHLKKARVGVSPDVAP